MTPTEAARVLFEEAWNEQDFTSLQRLLADEVLLHIAGNTRTTDIEDLERTVASWHAAFPDLRFEIHSITADETSVAVRATLHGTHLGPWGDRQPTGASISVDHAFFLRMENGLIAEVWEFIDNRTFTHQLSGGKGP